MTTITKTQKCQECGKEYKPLSSKAVRCYECYKLSERSKQKKYEAKVKIKKIDTQLNKEQSLTRPLNEEEKAQIAYMLGRFSTISEIQDYFLKHSNKEINYESVKSIRDGEKYKALIENHRKEWLSRISEVPIANKRVRMEAWQVMMEKGFNTNKMNIVKSALQGAREEIEGIHQQIGGNNYSLTYIANMSDNELLQKRNELMSKIKYITKQIEDEPLEIESEVEDAEPVTIENKE